jgi:hypothetical protein
MSDCDETMCSSCGLTREESEFIARRRKQIADNETRIRRTIQDAFGRSITRLPYPQWEAWPGTESIARHVYDELIAAGILKRESL